jgi:hypothetical protein
MILRLTQEELEGIVRDWAKSRGMLPAEITIWEDEEDEVIHCEINLEDYPNNFPSNAKPNAEDTATLQ